VASGVRVLVGVVLVGAGVGAGGWVWLGEDGVHLCVMHP